MNSTTRSAIVNLSRKLIGTPYVWGGSSPRAGFDCSGLVIWVLQVFDVLPAGDWTAAGLRKLFPRTTDPQNGDLVFYGRTFDKITHCGIFAKGPAGEGNVISASGGDSSTLTPADALRKNAMVKEKPVTYRNDFQTFGSIEGRVS